MPIRALNSREPSHSLLHTVFFIEQTCIIIAIQFAVINILSSMFFRVENFLPAALLHMRPSSASAALCASLALFLMESGKGSRRNLSLLLGAITALIATSALLPGHFHSTLAFIGEPSGPHIGPLSLAPLAFLVLGLVILSIRATNSTLSHIADGLACLLAFIVWILFSEFIFGLMQIPGSSIVGPIKLPTLACLGLLTLAVVLRRAESGIFSFLLAGGIEGQVSRLIAPLLLALPIIREIGRARLLDAHLVPARYATAILSSTATFISFLLLFALSRLIHRMQSEVQELNLRDELTGLYNFRGFNLFAEQACRLAARSNQPFGVLFVDMDNLKLINDTLGHTTGSVFLVETAKLLTSTFRETDVIGRLGGDEFVVAGLFDQHEIDAAIDRLRLAASSRNILDGKSLSLSLGYASAEPGSGESLKTVVARADKAMYKEKREKKKVFAL